MRTIDLNADAGEDPARLANGHDEALLRVVTSVNIACAGHAGDDDSVRAMVDLAQRHGVRIVAHPSYPDRANFGRVHVPMTHEALRSTLEDQLALIRANAPTCDTVKPHGALYHDSATDPAIARTLASICAGLRVVLPPTLTTRAIFEERGCTILLEGFADRALRPDGTLLPRPEPGALIDDPERCAEQALNLACESVVGTLCVHSDTPNALEIAIRIRATLEDHAFDVRAP